jgi:hypothetical protein
LALVCSQTSPFILTTPAVRLEIRRALRMQEKPADPTVEVGHGLSETKLFSEKSRFLSKRLQTLNLIEETEESQLDHQCLVWGGGASCKIRDSLGLRQDAVRGAQSLRHLRIPLSQQRSDLFLLQTSHFSNAYSCRMARDRRLHPTRGRRACCFYLGQSIHCHRFCITDARYRRRSASRSPALARPTRRKPAH